MKNIWSRQTPFFIQAPMENVTDTVFRQIISEVAKPDMYFTEFTNADGLCSKGFDDVSKRLIYSETERPIIAQIWGSTPEYFFQAAKMIGQMGFDGIDINMGCPERSVTKRGLCAALIKNHVLAHEIIIATQKGAGKLPLSVKTRIGFSNIETESWLSFLLSHNLDALTIHGRTAKEMSKAACHWDEISKAVGLRNNLSPKTRIIGNGDINSYKDGLEKINTYGLDGVMIGRAIFSNIGVFDHSGHTIDPIKKLELLIRHLTLFEKTWGNTKDFNTKFFKIYTNGLPNATDIREKLSKMDYQNRLHYLQILINSAKNGEKKLTL